MTEQLPKELAQAEELIKAGKTEEALEIVRNFQQTAWAYLSSLELDKALEIAVQSKDLIEKIGEVTDLAMNFLLLGWIIAYQGDQSKALEYAMKSLELNKELNRAVGIADSYSLIARIYSLEGDYDRALQYCKQSLSINEIRKRSKRAVLDTFSEVYYSKSEMNRALKYRQQAVTIAEELNIPDQLIHDLNQVGFIYRAMGKYSPAIEYSKRSLVLSEEVSQNFHMARSLGLIILSYIDEKSREKANRYLSRLSELYDQRKNKADFEFVSNWYLVSKAYMMRTSTRIRDRADAQAIFKELYQSTRLDYTNPLWGGDFLVFCLGNLCDLLLEELSMFNDPEIMDEITPLITKGLGMGEEANNYYWLALVKLLQAKLTLIQMNPEEARKLMVEAQRIAELHGISLLAWGISSEHDKLLGQIDVWDKIEREEAPMAERINLASTNGVLERLQGRRAMESHEMVDEQSTVLLILAEDGVLVFSYPFSNEWKIDEDLFSSFLSAFTSFSTEFFSKGLDRAKFGEDMMLMESIGSFSFCYLFKGQTYLARQRLTRFIEKVQNNLSLWQYLEQHYKTSQILELKEAPQMKSLITEIFISKS